MRPMGMLFGALGGVVAVAASVSGYAAIGTDPLYQERMGFGIAALLLGIIAGASGMIPRLHPGVAGVVMFVAGSLGFAATLAWYINTLYVVALPLWCIGAVLLLLTAARAPRPASHSADGSRTLGNGYPHGDSYSG